MIVLVRHQGWGVKTFSIIKLNRIECKEYANFYI